jgi:hypothetical protein
MPAWKDVTPRGRRPKGEESMSIPKRLFLFMVLLSSLVLGRSSLLRADGGTARLSERSGTVEAAEPLPAWRSLWPWVAWPAVAVVLFSVHQVLVRRKVRFSAPA